MEGLHTIGHFGDDFTSYT